MEPAVPDSAEVRTAIPAGWTSVVSTWRGKISWTGARGQPC